MISNDIIKNITKELSDQFKNISIISNSSIIITDTEANLICFVSPDSRLDNIISNHINKEFLLKHINKLFKHNTNIWTTKSKTLNKCITSIESYSETKGYAILISEELEKLETAIDIVKKLIEQAYESFFKDYEIKEIVKELIEKHENLTLFSSLSKDIAKIHELNPLIEKISTDISASFKFDSFLILLRSDSATDLYISKRVGKKVEGFLENVLKVDLAQRIKQTGESIIIYEDSAPELPPSILCTPIQFDKSFFGMMTLIREKENQPFTNEEKEHLQMFAVEMAKGIHRILLYGTIKKKYFTTIASLAEAIDAKDPYTKGHSFRVAMYSVETAKKMKLSNERIEIIQIAGYLHDVGKIGIDEAILRKDTPLNDDEHHIIQAHPVIAAKILQPISFLGDISTIALQHHEKCDGSGYPHGLTKNSILLESRIIALCDSFDAMTTNRPYRKAFPMKKTFSIIKQDSGRHFDEEVSHAFFMVWINHLENNIFPFFRLSKKKELLKYLKTLISDY